jgi:hypothetical protein
VRAEPLESLLQRVAAQYNERPQGWRVFADPKGSVIILGPQVGYKLKLIPLNPIEVLGIGVDMDPMEELRGDAQAPSYGLRPLSGQQAMELFSSVRQGGGIEGGLLRRLLGIEPVASTDLAAGGVAGLMTGPVIAHPNLSAISEGQRELDAKLSQEAARLFRARRPFRAGIYG